MVKTLTLTKADLVRQGRWDIDFHLPAERIGQYPTDIHARVDSVANVSKLVRDPTAEPDETFKYVDISCVDVATGTVTAPQVVLGSDAPSRARRVIGAYDVLVSTVRPTRGAVAVVPRSLHNEIASTGFTVLRATELINPFYLYFVLRLPSTREQFRKWSTGSSYPAILPEDVEKTIIPLPIIETQDKIANEVVQLLRERNMSLRAANHKWLGGFDRLSGLLSSEESHYDNELDDEIDWLPTDVSNDSLHIEIASLEPLISDIAKRRNSK